MPARPYTGVNEVTQLSLQCSAKCSNWCMHLIDAIYDQRGTFTKSLNEIDDI